MLFCKLSASGNAYEATTTSSKVSFKTLYAFLTAVTTKSLCASMTSTLLFSHAFLAYGHGGNPLRCGLGTSNTCFDQSRKSSSIVVNVIVI